MSFTGQSPPPAEKTIDEPGTMHIGGPGGRRLRELLKWMSVILLIAAAMVGLFIRFGATVGWAFGLVGLMLIYMAMMGRWAGGGDGRG